MDALEAEWEGRDAADPAVVAELSDGIRAVVARKGLEAVLAVGRLLYERCHSGVRARVGRSATIDAIAAQEDAPAGRASLYRSVQILLQWEDLPPDIRDELGPAQHAALLVVPRDHTEKIPLAREAALTRMPARELQDRARALVGRPALSAAPKPRHEEGLQSLSRATRVLEPWIAAARAGRRPTPREAEAVRSELARLRVMAAELTVWVD